MWHKADENFNRHTRRQMRFQLESLQTIPKEVKDWPQFFFEDMLIEESNDPDLKNVKARHGGIDVVMLAHKGIDQFQSFFTSDTTIIVILAYCYGRNDRELLRIAQAIAVTSYIRKIWQTYGQSYRTQHMGTIENIIS